MKSKSDYLRQIQESAEVLEEKNNRACILLAETLRLHDRYVEFTKHVGRPNRPPVPAEYLNALYRILSFAPIDMRAVILLGSADDVEALVSKVQSAKGFETASGYWMEL